ncbi:MAG: hypothetical protein IJM44_04090 [Ruminococcus sp.]|nr:hypothetical protein [Ruminococcus sp.]
MSDLAYSNDFWIAVSAFLGVAVSLGGLRKMKAPTRRGMGKEAQNDKDNS